MRRDGRPRYGYNEGSQVEYWLAHNGDRLVVKLSGTDSAYLYWRWDGVTLNNADAVIAPGAAQTFNIANWNNGTGLAGLYQFQPVRVMLRSTYHPNNSIFVDYLYQTDSNAGPSTAVLPAFTNGTASNANDLNLIQAETEYALELLSQPIPCQYSNDDRAGTRSYYVGYVRHQHNRFCVDVTLDMQPQDNFYVRYNGGDVTGVTGQFDGVLAGPTPSGLTIGDWYKVELVIDRYNNEEHEQRVKLWSYGEIVGDSLITISPMDRWTHGDTAWKLKANVDHLFSILPFEKEFFRKFDWEVDYVGNPVLDAIKAFEPDPHFLTKNDLVTPPKIVALLPGSRSMELKRMIPVMAEVVRMNPDYQFVVAAVKTLPEELYQPLREIASVKFVYESTYDLLTYSRAAIVTSGTATLETGLFKVPQAVIYKAGILEYWLLKQLVKIPFISLSNLIANRLVIKEFIQFDMTATNLNKELKQLVEESPTRKKMLTDYGDVYRMLDTGSASENTARLLVDYLKSKP